MIAPLIERALAARKALLEPCHESALRLFSGFYEGCPELVVDLYGKTIILYNYAEPPQAAQGIVQAVWRILNHALPWVESFVLKVRYSERAEARRGVMLSGEKVATWVHEHGVRYALELFMHQDASLYLDTRNLRLWAIENLADLDVLNTFAYTGSLGVAAMAGKARRVVHTDLNRRFLNLAKTSYTLNGFPIDKRDFRSGDFWTMMQRMKGVRERFDCIFLDPPFFSTSSTGTVDMLHYSHRLINKLRPLVKHGGWLVVVNNALFLSGADCLQSLCPDDYVTVEQLLPVPQDITGYPETRVGFPPVDPTPFNHPTKIAVLRVRHAL
ncbi:MAG: class I SAM-dependent methyltransferase [Anaerolineales bacterium]|nr:class I SAM-dependent methyltransferase [Anaerolineales bacterium]